MRWTQLLAADPGSLLCDSIQILTAFIYFTRTYCNPKILNLKCASMYNRIDRMREHDMVLSEVVRRRGCKRFGIAPNRITSLRGNCEAVLLGRLWYFYLIVHQFALHVNVIRQRPEGRVRWFHETRTRVRLYVLEEGMGRKKITGTAVH